MFSVEYSNPKGFAIERKNKWAVSKIVMYLHFVILALNFRLSKKISRFLLFIISFASTKNLFSMVFCYQNCSDLLWEKIVLVFEKNFLNSRLKAENLKIYWDHLNNLFKQWKVRTLFWWQNSFSTCSWRFFRSRNFQENLGKIFFSSYNCFCLNYQGI